jgi:heterodisulfide reductase subunit C
MATKPTFSVEISNLLQSVASNPLTACMQCGTCSSSCPAAPHMDHSPREILALIAAGQRDEVLASNAFWYCASCYQCTVLCPRGINIAEMMYALKRYSLWKRSYPKGLIGPDFSSRFVTIVTKTGRSFEPGLAPAFIFKHGIRGLVNDGFVALRLLLKGRLSLIPQRIQRIGNFRNVVGRILPIARAA